jgi:hypothetical protein
MSYDRRSLNLTRDRLARVRRPFDTNSSEEVHVPPKADDHLA